MRAKRERDYNWNTVEKMMNEAGDHYNEFMQGGGDKAFREFTRLRDTLEDVGVYISLHRDESGWYQIDWHEEEEGYDDEPASDLEWHFGLFRKKGDRDE